MPARQCVNLYILLAQAIELETASCLSKLAKADACITLMYAIVIHLVKSGHRVLDSTSTVGLAAGLAVVTLSLSLIVFIIVVVAVVVVLIRRRRSRTSRFSHIVLFHLILNCSCLMKFASNM